MTTVEILERLKANNFPFINQNDLPGNGSHKKYNYGVSENGYTIEYSCDSWMLLGAVKFISEPMNGIYCPWGDSEKDEVFPYFSPAELVIGLLYESKNGYRKIARVVPTYSDLFKEYESIVIADFT